MMRRSIIMVLLIALIAVAVLAATLLPAPANWLIALVIIVYILIEAKGGSLG